MYVCIHEVTQSEYETYCKYAQKEESYIPNEKEGKGANYPAYYLNWYDAIIYCNLRSLDEGFTPAYSINGETDPAKWNGIVSEEIDGKIKYCGPSEVTAEWKKKNSEEEGIQYDSSADGYRLPTDPEWEYIARGGNKGIPAEQTKYSGSNDYNDTSWCYGTSEGSSHPVMTKKPNSLGIYDMCGNVWEMSWECSSRGGNWGSSPCDVSYGAGVSWGYKTYGNGLGLRVVRNAD